MSRRGASPFSVAQRPLRAGRATKPARFYDEVRDRDGAAREENRQRQGADEAREFFFSFFFRRAILPASSSPSRESIRLTPPPLLPSDIHLSPTGGPPGSRHASRAGRIEGTEALLEESRAKNETRRERFNRRRQRERERQGRRRQARESRAVAGALGFRAPLNLGPPRRQNPLFSPPKIQIGALRRYAAVFGLDVSGTCTRDELTRAIARHWDEQAIFLFPFFFPHPLLVPCCSCSRAFCLSFSPFSFFPPLLFFFLLPLFPNLRTSIVASP